MNLNDKLANVIKFARDEDNFGKFDTGTTLESVIFGTLRKDLQIADDLCVLLASGSAGISMIALCRIIVEDYIHLSYLMNSHEDIEGLLASIDKHPNLEAYLKVYALKEWGMVLTQKEEHNLVRAKKRFDRYKDDFLRHGRESAEFNSDDYYRTWTKKRLDTIIRESGISDTETRSEMGLIKQLYDLGSDIIHHNAFLIWQFSRNYTEIIMDGLPQASSALALSTLGKIVSISLQVKYSEDTNLYTSKLNELSDLIL